MKIASILELQSVTGTNAKQEVIRRYSHDEWFKMFLYFALNPLLTYNLSEKTLTTVADEVDLVNAKLVFFHDIFECCEFLSRLRGIDDATIKQVQLLLYQHCSDDERDIYIKLLAKTLRLGVTAKTVNKIIPDLIPEWEVQQAFPIEKHPVPDGATFWITQKLNGVRATFYNGQLIARSGVPFNGLDHIIDEIKWAQQKGIVLDGELTLKNKNGISDNEAFRIATGIVNSDSVNKTAVCYTIFDAISLTDFNSDKPRERYSTRREMLDGISRMLQSENAQSTSVVPVLYGGIEQSKIDVLLEQMVREDKEGLMVNLDVPYKRARHKGILKVKRFYTMDLRIVRAEEGSGRLKGTLGALVLDYKGNEVRVGSGFSDEQRDMFWSQQESLTDMLCEVKYKEISSDKNTGLESLQFPVFVRIRDDKSSVSYG